MFVDTNVFAYALLDRGAKGDACREFLDIIAKGKIACTSALVLDELMWVLMKNSAAKDFSAVIANICSMPNLEVFAVSGITAVEASKMIAEFRLKPRDAMHVAAMRENGIIEIASDDKDFERVSGIRRIKLF